MKKFIQSYPKTIGFTIGALLTWYVWFDNQGNFQLTNFPDGRNGTIIIGPQPSPYPPIVHPNIESAGTPRPGVHVPL